MLAIEPNTVTRLRTPERDGYTAVQIGTDVVEEAEQARGRPAQGPAQGRHDPRVPGRQRRRRDGRPDASRSATCSSAGDLVDVTGVSKGKGFAGHIKRHNFHRGPKTHGSDHHRAPGSIGPGTTPGRVYRGLKMAGHMGDERVTIKKVRVVRTDPDRNLLLVKGSLPGARGGADPREEGLTDAADRPLRQDRRDRRQRRAQRRALRRPGQRRRPPPGRDRPARRPPDRARTTPRPAARSVAAARSRTARRAPAAPARAPSARRTTVAAASSSGRTRARTSSACRAR